MSALKRTIAAILAADVAGYSRLIAEDEDDTLSRFAEYSAIYREEVARVRGRVFNTAGDAILAEFPSAVEALRAAIAIQERLRALNLEFPPTRRVQFRMGLTIGDVVEVGGGDLLGDGVNVAARLEGIAEPGGICISRSVHEAIAARLSVGFRDIGPQRLKNIPRPVHAFRVILPSDGQGAGKGERRVRLPLLLKAGAAFAGLALAIGLGWAVLPGLFRGPDEPSGDPAAESGDPAALAAAAVAREKAPFITVATGRPKRVCFEDQVWLNGTLVPRREIDVGADSEGLRIQKVLASPMDKVGAGQVLAQLARPDQPDQTIASLRAPVSGTIGRSTAVVGGFTTFRGPALFQIIAQGELELAAEAQLRALDKLKPGQSATVTPLGFPNIVGRVRMVAAGVDGATQLGQVRLLLRTNADLRQGMFARAVVTVGERCGLAVPASAVLKGPEGSVVYVSNNGRVEGRLVTTGLTNINDIEITEGLDANDAVVLRAGPFVREGDAIRPQSLAGADAAE